MARILIIGYGDVGSRIGEKLSQQGHTVFGLSRRADQILGITPIRANVLDTASLANLPQHIEFLIFALAPQQHPDYPLPDYDAIYHQGPNNILNALDLSHLHHTFYLSSASVYAEDAGEWVDIHTPTQAHSNNSTALLAGEALIQERCSNSSIIRLAGLYGPGRLRLINWLKSGKPVQAEPPLWTNRIHVDDAAGIVCFLIQQSLEKKELLPLYLGVDNRPCPQHEVLDWLADEQNLPRVAHEIRLGHSQNKRMKNAPLLALGYVFLFPDYQQGYRHVLQQEKASQV